ncbi:MAG TPA: hypothetical protein VMS31_23305 [Pyrinomonadaceae bacterium]|nr:hypothetical protein [Pyrinomonadaceae bacterium]
MMAGSPRGQPAWDASGGYGAQQQTGGDDEHLVVRAFIQMREQLAANSEILKRLAQIDQTLLQPERRPERYLPEIAGPLLQPAPHPPRRRIGFAREDDKRIMLSHEPTPIGTKVGRASTRLCFH